MGGLQRFEQRLEELISGVFARTFRSAVQPVEITAALQREMDNNAQILSRNRRMVPNDFHVELAQTDLDRLAPYDSTLERELTGQLQEHADSQSYVFPGPIKIGFENAEDLTTGRFRIRSEALASVSKGHVERTTSRQPKAILEVNGTQHPLQPPGLVVGRGSEADIRINDPGVSRRHAEFVVISTTDGGLQIEVHDMGSTNGIRIDGRKSPNAVLTDGSVVQIAHTKLTVRFVQEAGGV